MLLLRSPLCLLVEGSIFAGDLSQAAPLSFIPFCLQGVVNFKVNYALSSCQVLPVCLPKDQFKMKILQSCLHHMTGSSLKGRQWMVCGIPGLSLGPSSGCLKADAFYSCCARTREPSPTTAHSRHAAAQPATHTPHLPP